MKYFNHIILTFCALCTFQTLSAQCPLTCNDEVQVSLDAAGGATIYPEMILEGDYSACNVDFVITVSAGGTIFGGPAASVQVDCDHVGEVMVTIEDLNSGNTCWGSVEILDMLGTCDFGGNAVFVTRGLCTGYDFVLNGSESLTPYNDCIEILPNLQPGTNTLTFDNVDVGGLNGISSLDIVLMIRGVINGFANPIEAILTDIDMSGAVSTTDIVNTRMHILGILNGEEINFVKMFRADEDYTGFDPFNFVNDYHQIQFDDSEFDILNNLPVYVYKLGDLNGNAMGVKGDDEVDTRSAQFLTYENPYVVKGNKYEVEFALSDNQNVKAFTTSFGLNNASDIEISSTYLGSDLMSNVIDEEVLLSYLSLDGSEVTKFNVSFTAEENGYLSDFVELNDRLSNDIVVEGDILSDLNLRAGEKTLVGTTTVFPNPANSDATIMFSDDYVDQVKDLSIYNTAGQIVRSLSTKENTTTISRDATLESGLYFIHVQVGSEVNRMKLIFN